MDESTEGDPPRTIVLADDDVNVRSLVARVLQGRGYRVCGTSDGGEALAVLANLQQPVHLLITDVTMPGMTGEELIRSAKNLRPGLPIICLSARVKEAATREGVHFMPKPFSLAGLVQKVCGLLANST